MNDALLTPAHQMYAAALYYLIFGLLLTVTHLVILCGALPTHKMGPRVEKAHEKIFGKARTLIFWIWFSGLICTWLASWLFWSRYVRLVGTL